MNIYLVAVLSSLFAAWFVDALASWLDMKSLDPVPPREFQGVYNDDEYRKSQDYARARAGLSVAESALEMVLLAAFILAGGFAWADGLARGLGLPDIAAGLVFFAVLGVLAWAMSLPWDIYSTFVVEERFGFNRTTWKTFVLDQIKSALVAVVVGGPILALVLYFFQTAGRLAWVWAWGAAILFSLVIQWLAPAVILPLFNKFTALGEGPTRRALEATARAAGVALSGIYVIDGSRRSAKSNAYFTGFGRTKRVALYDTLLKLLADRELAAVLAHEAGHHRLGHIPRFIVAGALKAGLMFWLLSLFLDSPGLYAAFGVQDMPIHAGLVFFLLLYTPVSLVSGPVFNWFSRRFERQADAFAARVTGDPGALATALRKLSASNMSNLTPHGFSVALRFSHPPVLERIRTLEGGSPGVGPGAGSA